MHINKPYGLEPHPLLLHRYRSQRGHSWSAKHSRPAGVYGYRHPGGAAVIIPRGCKPLEMSVNRPGMSINSLVKFIRRPGGVIEISLNDPVPPHRIMMSIAAGNGAVVINGFLEARGFARLRPAVRDAVSEELRCLRTRQVLEIFDSVGLKGGEYITEPLLGRLYHCAHVAEPTFKVENLSAALLRTASVLDEAIVSAKIQVGVRDVVVDPNQPPANEAPLPVTKKVA